MRAQQQIRRIVSREEIPTSIFIGVVRIECGLPGERLVKVRAFASCLVKSERGPDHGGKVGRETWKKQLAIAPGMPKPFFLGHVACDEIERMFGDREPIRLVQNDAGVDQGRDHQSVPVGQNFVVKSWTYPV